MSARQRSIAAIAMVAASGAIQVLAQQPLLRTGFVEDGPVVLMPHEDAEYAVDSPFADVRIDVSSDGGLRTYRAHYGGRIYTAYSDLAGTPRRLAFDPAQRRFRDLTSTLIVNLHDYGSLDRIAVEHAAVWGKAYPELGFALVGLGPETDPAEAAERLAADPRVADARLHFEDPVRRPTVVPGPGHRSATPHPLPANAKGSLVADLSVIPTWEVNESRLSLDVRIYNWGGARSSLTTLRTLLYALVQDDATADPDDRTFSLLDFDDDLVLGIDPKGAPWEPSGSNTLGTLDDLAPGRTYFTVFLLYDGVIVGDDTEVLDVGYTGFTLDSLNRIQNTCGEPGRGPLPGAPDPLLAHQWHLDNLGQSAYSDGGGALGEDLRMKGVLRDGPTGDAVKVAVVDTGLEICHPDLRANVEDGASFNFNAAPLQSSLTDERTYRMESTDPFDFDATGGHGNSVAGLIGATAGNGIGGRGVAPGVQLRGYNMLSAADQTRALIDSLGASRFSPDSSDVDIFNMSFGSDRSRPTNPGAIAEQIFSHGTRRLRSGLGAIYVLAGGNGFDSCRSLVRDLNASIGCISSVGEAEANLPYMIVVGAFNADGRKSSYSSAGANLWISAPGGEYGIDEPALPTVDLMGWERGAPVILNQLYEITAPLDGEPGVNPHGDYTALMNGTSGAAAVASGAIAVLLDEFPGLSWRDVKHVLARTARRIDADIESVEATFGIHSRSVRLPWTVNAAGYAYHNWYGFGALDLDAAVAFARGYTPGSLGTFRRSGWFETGTVAQIPDNDAAGVMQTVHVSGISADASVEAVVLEVDIRHPFPNDLGVHLVSPHGTRSVVNQVFNETLAVEGMDTLSWQLLSNAFYGEHPNGNWRIEVFDAAQDDTGLLNAWRLRFHYGDHP